MLNKRQLLFCNRQLYSVLRTDKIHCTDSATEEKKALRRKYKDNSIFELGTLPLIITAPHGGWKKPTSIPDRVRNGGLLAQDLYTKEIAEGVYNQILRHYGQPPCIVANLISRRKVDPNRSMDEGTETEIARKLWSDYHNQIKRSIEHLHYQHNFGILIDIHGQTHKHGMVELGYLLKSADIKTNSMDSLNKFVLHRSSIRSLASRYQDRTEPYQLLKLFGDKLSEHNVPAMPSNHFEPDDRLYFFGAYTTETYNFHNKEAKKGMDAIQVEIPQRFRLTEEGRQQAIQAITSATVHLVDNHYMTKNKP